MNFQIHHAESVLVSAKIEYQVHELLGLPQGYEMRQKFSALHIGFIPQRHHFRLVSFVVI